MNRMMGLLGQSFVAADIAAARTLVVCDRTTCIAACCKPRDSKLDFFTGENRLLTISERRGFCWLCLVASFCPFENRGTQRVLTCGISGSASTNPRYSARTRRIDNARRCR